MTHKTNQSILQKKREKTELKIAIKELERKIKMREYVGPQDFLVHNHEQLINKEAKKAEEDLNKNNKKKKGDDFSRVNSTSSKGSMMSGAASGM